MSAITGIYTANDFLSAAELADLQGFFEQSVRWSYGWQSIVGEAPFCHWNHEFLKTRRDNSIDHSYLLMEDDELAPLRHVWLKLKAGPLKGHALVRCYANAHTFGVEGYPHFDAKEAGHFTTIFYINPVWKPEWAGETVFFNADADIDKAVLPRPGRMVTFPGTILHAARAVSRACPAMRVTLMFKTRTGVAQ